MMEQNTYTSSTSPEPAAPLPVEIADEISRLLINGEKIQAIRLYRMHSDASLKTSKEAVEAMAAGMGIEIRGSSEERSCSAMIFGFLLWMGLIGLSPLGVEKLVHHFWGNSVSSGLLHTLMVLMPIFLVVLSIILLIGFGKRSRKDRI
jgi:hypothetical protein